MTPAVAVMKFGGSSFTTVDRYDHIAAHLLGRSRAEQGSMVAVVSGRPGATERLREELTSIGTKAGPRATADLLTLADTESAHLLRAAVEGQGGRAAVLTGPHNGVVTDSNWMWARICHLDPSPLLATVADNDVVILPGGQASDKHGRLTWMGKNSSDLSAVAAAVTLELGACEIYSDVEGIYTADPSIVPTAQLIPQVSYSMAAALAGRGAQVLHQRSIRLAQRNDVLLRCRMNSANFTHGTEVSATSTAAVAVVVDLKSVLIEFGSIAEADRAHSQFADAGVQTARPEDVSDRLVAVTGGYVDVDRLLYEQDLTGSITPGRLVSLITGSHVVSYRAANDAEAIELGRHLHQQHVSDGLDAPSAEDAFTLTRSKR